MSSDTSLYPWWKGELEIFNFIIEEANNNNSMWCPKKQATTVLVI